MVKTMKGRLIAGICGISLLAGGELTESCAGGLSYFSDLSYYRLTEKVRGSTILTEEGTLTRNGIAFEKGLCGDLSVRLSGSADIGVMAYDGFRVNDMSRHSTVTSHLGTTEEIEPSLSLAVVEGTFVAPQMALGHTWYLRTASSEYWNIIYAKAGMAVRHERNGYRFGASGGAKLPFYTTIDIDWSECGYDTPFTLRPPGMVGGYAEISAENMARRWKLGLTFERAAWKMSDSVPVNKRLALPYGVVIQNNRAFQPDTEVLSIGLSFEYRF